MALRLKCARNTKVDQLDLVAIGDHHIRRLEVTKDNRRVLAMQVAQHIAELLPPTACACLRNASRTIDSRYITLLRKYLGQRTSFNEIHDEVMPATLDKEVTHARDTGMVELEQQLRLALKPIHRLATIDLALEIIEHLLHRTQLIIKTCIYSTIYCSHAP